MDAGILCPGIPGTNKSFWKFQTTTLDILSVKETKKKGKGSQNIGDFLFNYSGKSKDSRASSGVGLILNEGFKNSIHNINYINERLLKVTICLDNNYLHIYSTYAPDISKPKEEREDFFSLLHDNLQTIPQENI